VALKVLRADAGPDQAMARRFRSEIKLARKVRHRNVCAIHEFGQEGSFLFIAMELIDGLDLRQVILRQGALPPAQAYDMAAQIADGLQAIHDEGIIHRDLKSTNVMVDERGVVRLMDFGIAKRWEAQGDAALTATGQIVGTPEYMSPEQVRGQTLDYRSDLYSLGIVVFELFTGHVPFRGDTPAATILKHLQTPPPLEGPSAARLPADLVPILRKALAKKPDDRFPKARLMAQALRTAEARYRPSTAVPMPTGTIVRAASERSARRVVLGSLAGALLVAGAVLYVWQAAKGPSAPTASQAPAPAGSPASDEDRQTTETPPPAGAPAVPVAVAPAGTVVRINALPWARVRFTSGPAGFVPPALSDADRATPLRVTLPPGTYGLELENGGLTPPLIERIEVGSATQMDASFRMPGYDPVAAAARAMAPR
jgi:eukaryotic-like serine/threonine-protein kinase